MMNLPAPPSETPAPGGAGTAIRRHKSAAYVAIVTVGMVVGAGIFKSPALVASNAGSEAAVYILWTIGGLISLAGALCYSELATAFAHPGGDYHFLERAFGPLTVLEHALAANFACEDDELGGRQRLARDARFGILRQEQIDDGVGNLVGNLVRMSFGHGFRSEKVI
jgi:hypothetical protein